MALVEPNSFPIEDYLRQRPDPQALPDYVMCMEDRPTLLRELYWQLAGGIDGIGRDVATAMEIEKPYSFIKLGRPIHYMGAVAGSLLLTEGIQGLMHERCAAYGSALAVRETIIDRSIEVHSQAARMGANMSFRQFEPAVEASKRIIDNKLIVPIEISDADLQHGVRDLHLPPTPILQIVPGDHKAGTMVVDYETDALFDTRKAYEDGNPAYFIGMGIARLVYEAFEDRVPFSFVSFYTASIVRHAGVSLKLPQPEGLPLDIIVRGSF